MARTQTSCLLVAISIYAALTSRHDTNSVEAALGKDNGEVQDSVSREESVANKAATLDTEKETLSDKDEAQDSDASEEADAGEAALGEEKDILSHEAEAQGSEASAGAEAALDKEKDDAVSARDNEDLVASNETAFFVCKKIKRQFFTAVACVPMEETGIMAAGAGVTGGEKPCRWELGQCGSMCGCIGRGQSCRDLVRLFKDKASNNLMKKKKSKSYGWVRKEGAHNLVLKIWTKNWLGHHKGHFELWDKKLGEFRHPTMVLKGEKKETDNDAFSYADAFVTITEKGENNALEDADCDNPGAGGDDDGDDEEDEE